MLCVRPASVRMRAACVAFPQSLFALNGLVCSAFDKLRTRRVHGPKQGKQKQQREGGFERRLERQVVERGALKQLVHKRGRHFMRGTERRRWRQGGRWHR